jgi:hypothetical protein
MTYSASISNSVRFMGIDMIAPLGKPMEQLKDAFPGEITVDDVKGVAFLRIPDQPSFKDEWGLTRRESHLDFLSPSLPDGSYDMTVHEVSIFMSFSGNNLEQGVAGLLGHALKDLSYADYTERQIAREFVKGNAIGITFEGRTVKGLITLSHFKGFGVFIMRVSDSGEFFESGKHHKGREQKK